MVILLLPHLAVKSINAHLYLSGMIPEGEQKSHPLQVIVPPRHSPYLLTLRVAWQSSLRAAFNGMPRLPADTPAMRLVDDAGSR